MPHPKAVSLAAWVTEFCNTAWGRRLRPSKALVDAVDAALEDGYTEDDVRSAYWVTATIGGNDFLMEAMRPGGGALAPEIVLRHHGGINPQTGKEAVRWLDDRIARVEETSGRLVEATLARMPPGTRDGEVAFLKRAGFPEADGEKE